MRGNLAAGHPQLGILETPRRLTCSSASPPRPARPTRTTV